LGKQTSVWYSGILHTLKSNGFSHDHRICQQQNKLKKKRVIKPESDTPALGYADGIHIHDADTQAAYKTRNLY
jgi:hypothetical protein